METFNKNGVEIFSVGEWNGDKITAETLQNIVTSFEENKGGVTPHLKLGHNKEQALLKADGLPAAGYVERLYIQGDKLMADFRDIPKKIFKLLEKGAYKKVSIEMFENIKIKGKEYKNLLVAVALLGADTPGVMNLSDIMAMYETELLPKSYDYQINTFTQEETMPTKEELLKEVEAEILAKADDEKKAALDAQAKEFAAKDEAKDKELSELRQLKADAEKKALDEAVAAKEAGIKAFVTTLKAEKLCSVAMEPLITQFLSDAKEYSVGEKKFTKEDAVKEMLSLFKSASAVNFEENSVEGKKDNDLEAQTAELTKEAKEYAAKNGGTFGQALIKVKQSKKKG